MLYQLLHAISRQRTSDECAPFLRAADIAHVHDRPTTQEEIRAAQKRVKCGKAAGIDGIPSDVTRNLSALVHVMTELTAVMFQFAVYPSAWGVSVVKRLLKPSHAALHQRALLLSCELRNF